MNEHRIEFHEELDRLREDVVRLGGYAIETVAKGTEALLNRDLGAAQLLVDGDDLIDRLAFETEDQALRLLALQNPMAGDLRFIVCSLWVSSELERSADLMVNICKAARRIYDVEINPAVRGLIEDMSLEAASLTRKAVDAYASNDDVLAVALDDIDDRLDDLQTSFVEAVFGAHKQDRVSVRSTVQLAMIGRYYERIGDHAVNIGERVHYMVTGGNSGDGALEESVASG